MIQTFFLKSGVLRNIVQMNDKISSTRMFSGNPGFFQPGHWPHELLLGEGGGGMMGMGELRVTITCMVSFSWDFWNDEEAM